MRFGLNLSIFKAFALISVVAVAAGCNEQTTNAGDYVDYNRNQKAEKVLSEEEKKTLEEATSVKQAVADADYSFVYESSEKYSLSSSPLEKTDPEKAMELLNSYVTKVKAALVVKVDTDLSKKLTAATTKLALLQAEYTPERLARIKSDKAENARLALEESRKKEKEAAERKQKLDELDAKVSELEKKLDDMGLAFNVTNNYNQIEVTLSKIPSRLATKGTSDAEFMSAMSEYFDALFDLYAYQSGDAAIATSLKQQLVFSYAAPIHVEALKAALDAYSAVLAQQGIQLRPLQGTRHTLEPETQKPMLWDLSHYTNTGKDAEVELVLTELTLISETYDLMHTNFSPKKLRSSSQLRSSSTAFAGIANDSWSSKNPKILDGAILADLGSRSRCFKRLAKQMNSKMTKEDVSKLLANDSLITLDTETKYIEKQLAEVGIAFEKTPDNKCQLSDAVLKQYLLDNRFKPTRHTNSGMAWLSLFNVSKAERKLREDLSQQASPEYLHLQSKIQIVKEQGLRAWNESEKESGLKWTNLTKDLFKD